MATSPVGIGDVIAGKYIVERVIGEGGMGIVVAARHRELEQRVAIKFLLPEIAEQGMAAERFRREARSAARMRGAHVCRVLDVGTAETGVPFMVMEYLEGRDLASELEQRGRVPHEEAVGYVLQACEALAEAHAAGVIHRDLKPANLFLEACADGSRRIKVLDFGVSKSLLDATPGMGALTKTSNLVGSPLYMSPEQLDSAKDVDPRTDVWALGIVLYELMAGCTPFKGDSIPQLVTAVLHEAPRTLASQQVDVPAGLETVVQRSLEKRRQDRYASVAEFVNALMPFAPPHAAGAAGRVSRLLSLADPQPPVASSPVNANSARATPSGPTPTASATPMGAVSTPLSWSRTTRKRNVRLGVGLLVLLALALSIGGFYAYRSSSSAPASAARPRGDAPANPPSATEPAASPVAPAAATAPQPGEPSAPAVLSGLPPPAAEQRIADAGSVAAPAAVVKPAPAKAEVPVVAAPVRVEPARPRPREPERRPELGRTPIAPGGGPISDFGGRR
jgi:serine/threonine protein kinase